MPEKAALGSSLSQLGAHRIARKPAQSLSTQYGILLYGRGWRKPTTKAPAIRWRSQECFLSLVIDFLAERFEAAANTETLSESALYTDYAYWCRASDREALSAAAFVEGFDRLRAENGLGKIRKRKGSYCGIRLATSHEMLMTG